MSIAISPHAIFIFLFVVLHVWLPRLNAQDSAGVASLDSPRLKRIREHIKPMGDYVTFKLTQTTDVESFSVSTTQVSYDIIPNVSSSTRISFSYRFVSFGVSFAPKFIPGNNDEYLQGKTKTGGFGFGLSFDHWQQDLGFSKVKGYYLGNTEEFRSNWREGDSPYIQFPNLQHLSFHGRTGYKFNSRFSVNAVTSQSERQLKSAGSFIPALSYRYYIFDDRGGSAGAEKSSNFESILHVGYYYNFVIRQKIYVALGATPGFGWVFTSFYKKSMPGNKTQQTNAIVSLDGRLGIGYNGERLATGFYTTLWAAGHKQQNTPASNGDTRLFYQFFLAYRFPAPSFLKNWVDWSVEEGKRMVASHPLPSTKKF